MGSSRNENGNSNININHNSNTNANSRANSNEALRFAGPNFRLPLEFGTTPDPLSFFFPYPSTSPLPPLYPGTTPQPPPMRYSPMSYVAQTRNLDDNVNSNAKSNANVNINSNQNYNDNANANRPVGQFLGLRMPTRDILPSGPFSGLARPALPRSGSLYNDYPLGNFNANANENTNVNVNDNGNVNANAFRRNMHGSRNE